ncbi:MAG TPA: phosphatidate cytidylyltransferase [Opitutaceae bacterium]|jgi:phosphatidate cytidylyltransferase|nr:phosphatidate cytidylyltransferase [Opitutaceae bacterium]
MAKRIFSTVFLWLGIFAVLWFFRTTGAVVAITVVSVLTMRELYLLMAASGNEPFAGMGLLFGALITLAPWTYERFGIQPSLLLPLAVVVCAIRIVLERPPEKRVDSLTSTLFGIVYVPVMLQYLVRIVTPVQNDMISPDGRLVLCLWVVAVSKFCDVGALLTGLAIGKTPMAPLTSPKKTWEGAAGGVIIAMAVGALVAWLGRSILPTGVTPLRAALIACPLAVVAIFSDLVESVLKRRAALKDSGGGVPGIGGIFDLSDSLILAAPVGYVLLSRLT